MTEPVIDPATGKLKEDGKPPAEGVVISPEEWGSIKGRLDTFEKMGFNVQPAAPAVPAAPAGPTLKDQLKVIDDSLDALSLKIDDAITNQKPVAALLTERDGLSRQYLRLQIKHEDIDPAFAVGIETIDQLSETVTRGQMPHLDLVRGDYDVALQSLPPEQRMNPKMRQAAYNIAVGQNVDKIMTAKKEEDLRAASAQEPPPPGDSSRAAGADQDTVPKPEDVLSRDTLKALKLKGQSVDAYYKSIGYEDGWGDFWKKSGKEYFG